MRRRFQLGPIARLAAGVMSLAVALILMADAVFDLFPSTRAMQAEARKHLCASVAGQVAMFLAADKRRDLQTLTEKLPGNDTGIRSIGIRTPDGALAASSPGHATGWVHADSATPSFDQALVPLMKDRKKWADIEILFIRAEEGSTLPWLRQAKPAVGLMLLLLGYLAVYFYLRRALSHLNPSHAVPQRVKKAFDTLKEAVLIIDMQGQILLFNSAFDDMNGGQAARLEGSPIMQLGWLADGLAAENGTSDPPWEYVLRTNQTVQGKSLKVKLPDGRVHELMMNCSAIDDSAGNSRGCLVSFNDVTPLSEANASLKAAMQDLEASKSKIQEQNEELQRVAFNDPLTGCLNRRAFFSRAETLFHVAVDAGSSLICVMSDIDHFKSFNDRYGHSVGDLVIQQVANSLGRGLRSQDVLCRYGGEEFCILLVGIDLAGGVEIAERMRAKVENEAGPGVRTMEGLRVTASFGLAILQTSAQSPEENPCSLQQLIELADQGLYVAKKQGRNRVASADGTIFSAPSEFVSN